MKQIYLWLFAILTVWQTQAQVATKYTFSQSTGTYTAITGGTVLASGSALNSAGYTVTLPTPFMYNGVSITDLRVNDDGYLALGVTTFTNSTAPISSSNAATGIVAGLAMNLVSSTVSGAAPEIRWEQVGNVYVFQWSDMARSAQAATEIFDFQIRIDYTTGVISLVYNDFSTVTTSTSFTPQVGLRGATNTDFNSRRLTTTFPDATPSWDGTGVANSNANTVRFLNTCYPVAGQTFTYTPATCNVISTFPWSENFDAFQPYQQPTCWFKENGDWIIAPNSDSTNDADARSGTNFLREAYSATNEYMWSPVFQLTAGVSYDFSFWWAGDTYATWDASVVYNTIQSSVGATAFPTPIVVAATTTTKNYQKYTANFIPATTGTYSFGIKVNAPSTPWYLSFDDFRMQPTPTDTVDWANLQAIVSGVPPAVVSTINSCQTVSVYSQVYEPGVTEDDVADSGMQVWIGKSSADTDPSTWAESAWTLATLNTLFDVGADTNNNDEFYVNFTGLATGTYYLASRYSLNDGPFRYGATNNGFWDASHPNAMLTVTDNPTFSVSATNSTICSGTSTDLMATSTNTNFTYAWDNGAGTGATVTVSPTTNTTYTATATDSTTGCTFTKTISINVNPIPTAITITPASPVNVCEGVITTLTATGGDAVITAFSDDFNAATSSWIATNNSTGGVPADAAWTLRPDGYAYTDPTPDPTFHSNDNTQFYLSNSDDQGSSSTTDTLLESPAFDLTNFSSANLSFWHYYRYLTGDITKVEVSTDNGGTWTAVKTYTATQGSAVTVGTAYNVTFVKDVIDLAAYTGQANVKIRFNYHAAWGYYWAIDNVKVEGVKTNQVVWSPVTDLYTDAGATTAYTAGSVAGMVYQKATTAGTATYTATATNSTGCFTSTSVDVVVTIASAPTGDAVQTVCQSGTLADLVATGTSIKWYDAATAGTELPLTTALVNGTHYFASQTVNSCESSTRLDVTANISTPATPTGAASQTFCAAEGDDLADFVVTATGTVVWYDAATAGNVLPSTTLVANGVTYYAANVVGTCESATRLAVTATESCPPVGCLNAPNGQWPSSTLSTTNCNGTYVQNLTTAGYTGEYTKLNVTNGQHYVFSSSVATDLITISDVNGTVAYAAGIGSVTWDSTFDGVIRFYTHLAADCSYSSVSRTRRVVCGVPPTVAPDCPTLVAPADTSTGYGASVAISWTAPTTGTSVSSYNVYLDTTTGTTLVGNLTTTSGNFTNLLPGTTYYWSVRAVNPAGESAACAVWSFTTLPAPANDNCSGATALTVGADFASSTLAGTLLSATSTASIAPTCQTSENSEVYYTVVVPASGNVTIEAQVATANSITDGVLAVYTGDCSTGLTQIACDDDSGPTGANNLMPVLTVTGQTPGTTLYVTFSKYGTTLPSSTVNAFQIAAYDCASSVAAPTGTANQSFCNAATVADLVATGTTIKWYDVATGGTELASTTALVNGSTYYASQTLACESFSRLAVTVAITTVSAPTAAATQYICSTSPFNTLADLNVTVSGTEVWYDAATAGNVLPGSTVMVAGTTYYVANQESGCTSARTAVSVVEDCALATQEELVQNFSVYPNPTSGSLTIKTSAVITNAEVFNYLGQSIINVSKVENKQLNVSNLPTGTYVLRVTFDNGTQATQAFIKN